MMVLWWFYDGYMMVLWWFYQILWWCYGIFMIYDGSMGFHGMLPSGKRRQLTNWKDPPCYFHGKAHYLDRAMCSMAM